MPILFGLYVKKQSRHTMTHENLDTPPAVSGDVGEHQAIPPGVFRIVEGARDATAVARENAPEDAERVRERVRELQSEIARRREEILSSALAVGTAIHDLNNKLTPVLYFGKELSASEVNEPAQSLAVELFEKLGVVKKLQTAAGDVSAAEGAGADTLGREGLLSVRDALETSRRELEHRRETIENITQTFFPAARQKLVFLLGAIAQAGSSPFIDFHRDSFEGAKEAVLSAVHVLDECASIVKGETKVADVAEVIGGIPLTFGLVFPTATGRKCQAREGQGSDFVQTRCVH
jgi:hypothetical protein